MNAALFEQLLNEEESSTLDFKQEQYKFSKASDDDKSEIVKDILIFANAWRREDAYILIGVEDVRGGRGIVHGIAEHLDDHSLQQFVNHLTNRPVEFSYEAFSFEGKQIGSVRVGKQTRPIYLKKDFGNLKKDVVYIRRGSATDTAKLDEVTRMGQTATADEPALSVQFALADRDSAIGSLATIDAEFSEIPSDIPDLQLRSQTGYDFSLSPLETPNDDFYREMAVFLHFKRSCKPLRIVVENSGEGVATDVRVELVTSCDDAHLVVHEGDVPSRPYRDHLSSMTASIAPMNDLLRRGYEGEARVREDAGRYVIEVECKDLQPGRRIYSDAFYVGRQESGDIRFAGKVLAANLAKPIEVDLTATIVVTDSPMTIDELRREPDDREADNEG
jgi:Putative DNA-binding domain